MDRKAEQQIARARNLPAKKDKPTEENRARRQPELRLQKLPNQRYLGHFSLRG